MPIRKYPNRRLYDMDLSRYVTVESSRETLMKGDFVVEHKSGRDITNEILGQVVMEDIEAGKGPTAEELRAFIAAYSLRPQGNRTLVILDVDPSKGTVEEQVHKLLTTRGVRRRMAREAA